MPGLAVISQSDFSGGMWPSTSPERIPANGVYDAQNALIDDTGGLFKRGGSIAANLLGPAVQMVWIWEGQLAGGLRRLVASAANIYLVSGVSWSLIGAYTGMAGGANRPAVLGGVMYLPPNASYDGTTFGTTAFSALYWISIANRLVGASNDNVIFSGVGATTFDPTDNWKIPGGVRITGLAALRDSAVVFTDQGTWVISNMALNLTDSDGNVQQRLDLYSPGMVLWGTGAAGVAGHQGGLIIPARDGVWLMHLGTASEAAQPLTLLSRPITALYQSYVAAGYRPGQAAISNGHYFLPILNGTTLIDLLVCRLNLPASQPPWTRFSGTVPIALTPTQNGQDLLGIPPFHIFAETVRTLFFGTGALQMQDDFTGTNSGPPTMSITTRDYLTGPLNTNTVVKAKLAYRVAGTSGANSVSATYGSADPVGTTPTALSGTAPATSGALSTFPWPISKRGRVARLGLTSAATAQTAIESLEIHVRPQGRR